MEDPAMTAGPAKQDAGAGAVKRTGTQRFFSLEQLTDQAQTISLIADALPVYRAQTGEKLDAGEKAQAFEIYKVLEQQRDTLAALIHATRPFLLELEHPLADAAEVLATQVAAFQLMTKDYSKLTAALKRFAGSLPTNQTTNASVIGRLMNNVRMGYYPTDPDHVTLITQGIAFPSGITTNLLDPCCGTGVALRRMATGNNCFCYGVELDRSRAEQAQAQLHRVGFGSFFGAHISFGAFHVVFLNPPYLSVLSESGGRSRDEKRFLLESLPLLTLGGLMVYIVPYYRLTEDILHFLASYPGIVFTKSQIYERVWREDFSLTSTSVSDHISSLRQKLGLNARDGRYIQTVFGVGYRFVAEPSGS